MALKFTKNGNGKLKAFSIWAIGVGLVISGESFGWNLGWAAIGPVAFFVPLLFTALLYYALVQCLIALACKFPQASSPADYCSHVFGKKWGQVVTLLTLLEFLFINPAVAVSIGEYLGFLSGHMGYSNWIATAFLAVFCLLSLFNLSVGIGLSIALTLLAIFELFIYSGAISASFSIHNLLQNRQFDNLSFANFIKALPFAIWMFLAIEGIALVSANTHEENFKKNITKGYNAAFVTLLILAFLILILAAGALPLNANNWAVISNDNHPMPASMALILGKDNFLVKIFTFIGLFGLIASLQGVAFATSVQIEEIFKKSKFRNLPSRLLAVICVFAISVTAIWTSQTARIIEFSVFAAVSMYFSIGLSTYFLGKSEKLGLSALMPLITSIFSLICILILAYLHAYVAIFMVILIAIFLLINK